MKELDVEIICANSPQAKGRVERGNQTLQNRLVKELRLRGINNVGDANEFLKEVALTSHSGHFNFALTEKSCLAAGFEKCGFFILFYFLQISKIKKFFLSIFIFFTIIFGV